MDQSALVSLELEQGTKIIEALDKAGLAVDVALWAFLDEYRDWRIIVSSRELDRIGPSGQYHAFIKALQAAGLPYWAMPPVLILPMTDRSIKDVRRLFGKTKNVEGMRLGGHSIGDRFLIDGYAYRIK